MAQHLEKSHTLAFKDCVPAVPVFPVTPRTLVHVAALFKSGGYRGFPNYLPATKTAHIEAGFEWDQLLGHTGAWVMRSVLRGIGPARQSCSFLYVRHKRRSCTPRGSGKEPGATTLHWT